MYVALPRPDLQACRTRPTQYSRGLRLPERTWRAQRGFTLPELAITLLVVGVLLSGGMAVNQRLQAQSSQDARMAELASFEDAVRRFAVRENRLPCPDLDGDGYEDRTAAGCPEGLSVAGLPWVSLAINKPTVPTGRVLTYAAWRKEGSDLVVPFWDGRASVEQGGVKQMLNSLADASAQPRDTDQPNVAPPTLTTRVDCVGRFTNPAFIISYEDPEFAAEDKKCLAGGRDRQLVAVGRYEMTGWWLRTAAVGFARE